MNPFYFLLPVVAVVMKSTSTIYSRWILRTFHVKPTTGIVVGFLVSAILMLIAAPWLAGMSINFLKFGPLALFSCTVALGLMGNIFALSSLKKESLRNFELIEVTAPFFTMGLAALVFVDERDPIRLALGLLAAGSFILTHIEHHHFALRKADGWLLVSVMLFSVEILLVKPLLELVTPVTYYGLRAGVIALIAFSIFRPRLEHNPHAIWGHVGLNSLIGVIRSIAALYSIQLFGIVTTQLFLLTEPILIALISVVGLKERWTMRQTLGFVVILVCVLATRFV